MAEYVKCEACKFAQPSGWEKGGGQPPWPGTMECRRFAPGKVGWPVVADRSREHPEFDFNGRGCGDGEERTEIGEMVDACALKTRTHRGHG